VKAAKENVAKTPGGRGYTDERKVYLESYGEPMKVVIEREWVLTPAGKREKKAHVRLSKLIAAGNKEALALDKEYERLKQKAQEALLDLRKFEKEQLGMRKTDQEEEED